MVTDDTGRSCSMDMDEHSVSADAYEAPGAAAKEHGQDLDIGDDEHEDGQQEGEEELALLLLDSSDGEEAAANSAANNAASMAGSGEFFSGQDSDGTAEFLELLMASDNSATEEAEVEDFRAVRHTQDAHTHDASYASEESGSESLDGSEEIDREEEHPQNEIRDSLRELALPPSIAAHIAVLLHQNMQEVDADDEEQGTRSVHAQDEGTPESFEKYRDANERMIEALKSMGGIGPSDRRLEDALWRTPRALFLPPLYRNARAFSLSPLRLTSLGFNVSSPEVYVSALTALDIQHGNAVLDVGSGCGHLTALAALLAGPSGIVVGIDIEQGTVSFSESNLEWMRQNNPAFSTNPAFAAAAPVRFAQANVFLLDATSASELLNGGNRDTQPRALFDRIHCGAQCTEENLGSIVELLNPGGILVTPCENAMLKIVRPQPESSSTVPLEPGASGTHEHRQQKIKAQVVSHVRFGALVVPTRAEVIETRIQNELRRRRSLDFEPGGVCVSGALPQRLLGSEDTTKVDLLFRRELESLSEESVTEKMAHIFECAQSFNADMRILVRDGDDRGASAEFFVHRAVLYARSGHFRARFSSGMRDAMSADVHVPPEFEPQHVRACLRFLYTDRLDFCGSSGGSIEGVTDVEGVLALVAYYDFPPELSQRCEQRLADLLCDATAVAILQVSLRFNLSALKRVAMHFTVQRFAQVRRMPGWGTMSPELLTELLEEACAWSGVLRGIAVQQLQVTID
ncbi:Protein-L-isoaspartate O-methyltransferase domain-containing protein 2 [Porphyridium purpureum]|uniref:protein-L-isoaspartate(D-aspartate) O-methyltransferase n=1 Tax=Porphyridium purpureum TaxID=35688 RepID=A0A5J4Z2H5_PORPP|nr:Protein-L-isoaspartate O-methyltransferase domain-containing protein 2 [Porphyridium purpureum]|eukprot:POR0372..scf295_1